MKTFQQYPHSKLKNFEICEDLDSCLNRLHHEELLAVAGSRERVLNNRFVNVYCFEYPETIHSYGLNILMKNDFLFVDAFNDFLKFAVEGGLIVKWQKGDQAQYKYVREKSTFSPLQIEYLFGFFVIYGSVWVLALFAAIAEKIVFWRARKPNPSKFWTYAEMAIDAERHFLLQHIELQ